MTSLTIELNEVTFARLEQEASQRGVDVATYVRDLLNQERAAPEATEGQVHPRAQKASADGGRWLDSPEAIVDWIRAQREKVLSVREATANLADLLASGGVDQGVPVDVWERRWAVQEEAEKAAERADLECALREQKAPGVHDPIE
jgi:hypothetical protein